MMPTEPFPDSICVLHVDDEPDFAEMAAAFVQREDDRIDVTAATSVDEGLEVLGAERVDCIVSDYDMPGRNGIEFLQAVRERSPDLPFILYTGKGSEEIASEAISAGVTDYLQKEGGTSQYTLLAHRITNAVEQYHSTRRAETSQKRLELFFEQSPLGAIEWTDSFEFVRVNATAEQLLGYTESELAGESWDLLVPEDERDGVGDVVDDLLAGTGGTYNTNEVVTADGERIVCEWHNRAITDDRGDVVAIFSKFQDVTAQKEYERELERQNDRLDQFASVVSHDLRNPLNVADGRVELAQQECDSEHLAVAERAHDRMNALIDDLLTFARAGDGIDPDSVDLGSAARSAWEHVETGGAALDVHADATVRADRTRLQQLLENLVRNAVDHASPDARPPSSDAAAAGVTVTVSELADGFYVADDGQGIPDDERGQVFQAGYSTREDGTGFGLSIVEQVVEEHGWEVAVTESAAGGARLEFSGVQFAER